VACFNGQESIEKVKEFFEKKKMFDVVLMDLIMPLMGGLAATIQIRKLEEKFNIPMENRLYICGYSS